MIVLEIVLGLYLASIVVGGVIGFFTEERDCLISTEKYTLTGSLVWMAIVAIIPPLAIYRTLQSYWNILCDR